MNKLGKKNNWSAYLYITPLMIFSFVLVYYCIIRTVVVSYGLGWDVGCFSVYRVEELQENAGRPGILEVGNQ